MLNQPGSFIETNAFSGNGVAQARLSLVTGDPAALEVDIDGNGAADFSAVLSNINTAGDLTSSDFIFVVV